MADRTARRMRKHGLVGRTVSISVRFADFRDLTRSATMPTPTDVTEEIYTQAVALYDRLGSTGRGSAGSAYGWRASSTAAGPTGSPG